MHTFLYNLASHKLPLGRFRSHSAAYMLRGDIVLHRCSLSSRDSGYSFIVQPLCPVSWLLLLSTTCNVSTTCVCMYEQQALLAETLPLSYFPCNNFFFSSFCSFPSRFFSFLSCFWLLIQQQRVTLSIVELFFFLFRGHDHLSSHK